MRNSIKVATAPYIVKGPEGLENELTERFIGRGELEDYICRIIAGGNVVYASRIKLVHRLKIKEICEYMMSILGGTHPSSDLMKQTLQQAIEELEIDINELRKITPEQIMEAKNSFPNNIRRK